MDARQESELVGLGNCQLHWHAADRAMDHDKRLDFFRVASTVTKSAAYTVADRDDYILVDQTCTITLPLAKNTGREMEIILIASGKATSNECSLYSLNSNSILGYGSIKYINGLLLPALSKYMRASKS